MLDSQQTKTQARAPRYPVGAPVRSETNGEGHVAAVSLMARPWWLPDDHWPFSLQYLELNGRRIAVTDVGSGPVLLFIHTGFWSFIWRDVIRLLATNFRCICFDSPGTGLSERVPREDISLANASRTTAAIIEALDLKEITLVLHDLGGPVGIAGAAQFAEQVVGIAAVNTFGWKPVDAKLRVMLNLVGSAALRELDVLTNLVPTITASAFGVGLHLDAANRRIFRAGIGREGVRAFHQYMHDAARSENLYEKSLAALVGPFAKLPVITIFGERNDPFHFQERWQELFPRVRQVVIRKGNHFPMCDAPELVAETLGDWRHRLGRATVKGIEL